MTGDQIHIHRSVFLMGTLRQLSLNCLFRPLASPFERQAGHSEMCWTGNSGSEVASSRAWARTYKLCSSGLVSAGPFRACITFLHVMTGYERGQGEVPRFGCSLPSLLLVNLCMSGSGVGTLSLRRPGVWVWGCGLRVETGGERCCLGHGPASSTASWLAFLFLICTRESQMPPIIKPAFSPWENGIFPSSRF